MAAGGDPGDAAGQAVDEVLGLVVPAGGHRRDLRALVLIRDRVGAE